MQQYQATSLGHMDNFVVHNGLYEASNPSSVKWKYICQEWKNKKIQVYRSWMVDNMDNDSLICIQMYPLSFLFFIASYLSACITYLKSLYHSFSHHYLWSLSLFHPPPHSLFCHGLRVALVNTLGHIWNHNLKPWGWCFQALEIAISPTQVFEK